MPLTPTDVANKQFRIAFRGYSLDEVDAFLDEVETELTRLLRENAGLRDRPAAAPAPAAQPVPAAPEAPAPAAPLASMEGQEAALRTLLLAQRTADEAIAEARAEAEQIVAAARSEAEAALSNARAEADQTLNASREKAARVDQEVAARVQAATGDLDSRRRELEQRIEELRAFEREYRTRLKAYLEGQLRDLETGAAPDDSGAGVPAGARSAAVAGATGARPPAPQPVLPAGSPSAGPAAPQPVPGRGGPGVVPGGAAGGPAAAPVPAPAPAADAPAGPPREAETPSNLRAVPPLAQTAPAVGPFTVVPPADSVGDDGADER